MAINIHPMCLELQDALKSAANPDNAPIMQGYMKTTQPFYGIKRPIRTTIFKEAKKRFVAISDDEFDAIVRHLWAGEYREDMYMALEVIDGYQKEFLNIKHWELFVDIVHSATWWDTLDWVAVRHIGPILYKNPRLTPEVFSWTDHESFWVRRAAIIAHLNHKKDARETDLVTLEATILKLAHEKEWFMRKAIGWVLRQNSRRYPEWVQEFVAEHDDKLSAFSKKEALRLLV